jgi:hypothetical protein
LDFLGYYLYAGIVAISILIVVFAQRAATKRRAALDALSRDTGWSFEPKEILPQALNAGPFPMFERGRRRLAGNILRGTSGDAAFAVFDYGYTTGGRQSNRVKQTVVHIRSPRLAVPPFLLSPERAIEKIGGAFGRHDIDFDASPAFSSAYRLQCEESEPYLRELFSPSVRDFFERNEKLTVEGHADSLLVYRQGRLLKPEELKPFAARAVELGALLARGV